jgi:hypothetical protein
MHCQISTSSRAPLWRKFGPFPGCGPWYVGRLSHQTITLIWWLMSLPFNGSTPSVLHSSLWNLLKATKRWMFYFLCMFTSL